MVGKDGFPSPGLPLSLLDWAVLSHAIAFDS